VKPRSPFLAYAPAVAWAAYLIYLGNRPFYGPLPDLPIPLDKVAHLVLYGTLGLLAALGWRWTGRRHPMILPMLASLAVGVIDEVNQRSVVTRTSDIFDWLTDAVAITLAFFILRRRSGVPDNE
jgi:VanZ family protein